jgi:hypothetical protein
MTDALKLSKEDWIILRVMFEALRNSGASPRVHTYRAMDYLIKKHTAKQIRQAIQLLHAEEK